MQLANRFIATFLTIDEAQRSSAGHRNWIQL